MLPTLQLHHLKSDTQKDSVFPVCVCELRVCVDSSSNESQSTKGLEVSVEFPIPSDERCMVQQALSS